MTQPQTTVLIATRNRRDELRRAITSCLQQTIPLEILIIDDGSTDGTSEMVRSEFPSVRLDSQKDARGLIVQRNRGARLASCPIVFVIDDDAFFPSPLTVEQTLADFDNPRVGVVAVPYVDVHKGPAVHQKAPSSQGIWVISDYRGTAHAFRREVFLNLGGYHDYLYHWAEERDYSLRLINAGLIVRAGRADPLHHVESPRRASSHTFPYHVRNHLLLVWYHVPLPYAPLHLLATTWNNIVHGLRAGMPWATARGIFRAGIGMWHERRKRDPISPRAYRLYRTLQKSGKWLHEIEGTLPPMAAKP